MKIGIVADDITGANDIGSMFANGGYLVHVHTRDDLGLAPPWRASTDPDVCIIDTNSRLDPADVAYRKVFTATKALQQAGYRRFFNKTCSVFRGNIGTEFDAMLDALDEAFAVVILGFPKNGRLTVNGVHYVHGQRLEASPFRQDPIHPMTQSHLVDILQAQTQRKVALLNHEVIDRGVDVLRAHVEQMRAVCNYLILDVPGQQALTTIAQAVADQSVFCGSSALAEELPALWGGYGGHHDTGKLPPYVGQGVLCAAGSLTPQTVAQIHHLQAKAVMTVEVDTRRIFDGDECAAEIERCAAPLVQRLAGGQHSVVYAANDPDQVAQTQAEGARRGLNKAAVGRLVGDALAEIVARALEGSGRRRLVVAGGETSAAICRRLGVERLRVWKEIQPGLPSCVSLADPPLLLVLKSGSFGTPDFLEQALDHLQAQ